MEFSCPECGAPHAFPDDQIPPDGIVVACTACAAHITLDAPGSAPEPEPEPEFDPEEPKPTLQAGDLEPIPMPEPEPEPPRAPPSDLGAPKFNRPSDNRPAPRPPGWNKTPGPPKPREFPKPASEPPSAPVRPPAPPPEPEPEAAPDAPDLFEQISGAAKGAARDVASAGKRALEDAAARKTDAEDDVPEGLAFPGFKPDAAGLYTWKDLPRAFLGVTDLSRLGFATGALWVAMVAFGVVSWVGALLAEKVWGTFGSIFGIVADLVLVAGVIAVTSVIGFVCYQNVVEQKASSVKAGIDWTQQWVKSVFGTPLAFVAVIVAVAAVHGVVGLVGRIPYAGPIVWGLLSGVLLVSALAAGFVALLLGYSLALYVPVIYSERTGPVETLKRLLELAKGHGATLVTMVLLTAAMIGAAWYVILMPSIKVGTVLMGYVGFKAMGGDLAVTIASNPFPAVGQATTLVFDALAAGGMAEPNIGHKLGGFLSAVFATGMLAFVGALLYVPYITAGGIIYATLTGKKKPR